MVGQGNLERSLKVKEKSGILKINCYGSHQKIYLILSKEKGLTFYRDSTGTSPSLGVTLKGKNVLL